ncbi:MAG TPA: hypothetical protein VNP97_11715 [Microbacterium sp.]|nr:hypothetical protein [Microbacterium sp.]
MLFVFLALYFALGVACIFLGATRRRTAALTCGIVAVALAVGSLVVWILYELGASHWTVSMLQVLLSPLPETLLDPGSFSASADGSGLPVVVVATLELIVAVLLWAIPIVGIALATRAERGAARPRP